MLRMPQTIYCDMVDHSREGFPLEVCGILGGKDSTISAIYRMTNADASDKHFKMNPREHGDVMADLWRRGLEMVAFYHSHPAGPPYPSTEDIRLAFYPDVITVIVSLHEPDRPLAQAFFIRGGLVEEVEIQLLRD
ncbi:MAG: M67 family peptidase [Deltaproteobacteria bacterium]|nr:M67 family peptidase [Deltaproteobacteria bacterium]TLM99666.1 MAG: M67 family metallopeptidase [bacterium]